MTNYTANFKNSTDEAYSCICTLSKIKVIRQVLRYMQFARVLAGTPFNYLVSRVEQIH